MGLWVFLHWKEGKTTYAEIYRGVIFYSEYSCEFSGALQLQEQLIRVALRQPYVPEYIPKPLLVLEENIRLQSHISPTLTWDAYTLFVRQRERILKNFQELFVSLCVFSA